MLEADFPEHFLFALKLGKNDPKWRGFFSFHKILSLLFAEGKLKGKT